RGGVAQHFAVVGAESAARLDREPAPSAAEAPLFVGARAAVDEAAMLGEVARRFRAAVPGEVAGARSSKRTDRREFAADEARILQDADADRGVEAAVYQVHIAVAVGDGDGDARILLREFGERRAEMHGAE